MGAPLTGICAALAETKASQIEDYLFIGGQSMPARAAAARLGVTPRTIQRWRRELRGGAPACPATAPGAAQPATRPAAASPAAPTSTATAATGTGPAAAAAGAFPQVNP